MRAELFRRIFEKYSNVRFYENSSSGSWIVPCERRDPQKHTKELIDSFRSFAKKPKNSASYQTLQQYTYQNKQY
jgi:hypothetical protein